MLAVKFQTPIINYSNRYILWRDASIKDKTDLLRNSMISDLFFIEEFKEFDYYWDILRTNGSTLYITTTTTSSTANLTLTTSPT